LITGPLHDAREHRVVEASPPGFEGRRRRTRLPILQHGHAVELIERRCRLSIRGADGATRQADLRKQAERGESGRERPHNHASIEDNPHVRSRLALPTSSIQCSTRSAYNRSRSVARDTLAQQKVSRRRLRVAADNWACLSRGLPRSLSSLRLLDRLSTAYVGAGRP